jgi:hypothetical protein
MNAPKILGGPEMASHEQSSSSIHRSGDVHFGCTPIAHLVERHGESTRGA